MASLWEIADPTNLKYNPILGEEAADSGLGAPSQIPGWVRTGFSSDGSFTPGKANCFVWNTISIAPMGTVINLHDYWTDGNQDIGDWNAGIAFCDTSTRRVWCVED
jgi:hypothetical protein